MRIIQIYTKYIKLKTNLVLSKYNNSLYKLYIIWQTFDALYKHFLSGFLFPKALILNTVGIIFQKNG